MASHSGVGDFALHCAVRHVFVLATSDCYYEAMVAASIEERFSFITEHWRPRVVAELNGPEVKLVKFQGEFPWRHHDNEDEMFLVWRGEMRVEFRDREVSLRSGEYCVAPRGVEHRTCADEEAAVILFEPAAMRNTGNVVDERFIAPDGNRL